MFTYVYKCNDCGEITNIKASFDERQKSDPKKFKCSNCNSTKIQQMISNANVITGESSSCGGCCGGSCGH